MTNIYPQTIKADVTGDLIADVFTHIGSGNYSLQVGATGGELLQFAEVGDSKLDVIPVPARGNDVTTFDGGYEFDTLALVTGDFASDGAYDDFSAGTGVKKAHFSKNSDGTYALNRVWDAPGYISGM